MFNCPYCKMDIINDNMQKHMDDKHGYSKICVNTGEIVPIECPSNTIQYPWQFWLNLFCIQTGSVVLGLLIFNWIVNF